MQKIIKRVRNYVRPDVATQAASLGKTQDQLRATIERNSTALYAHNVALATAQVTFDAVVASREAAMAELIAENERAERIIANITLLTK